MNVEWVLWLMKQIAYCYFPLQASAAPIAGHVSAIYLFDMQMFQILYRYDPTQTNDFNSREYS